jgi:RNA polymerase sigma-54 factor
MEVLQLSTLALEERIEQELASNPTLELRDPDAADVAEVKADLVQMKRDDREGERVLKVENSDGKSNQAYDFERLANISDEYTGNWESNNYESGEDFGGPDFRGRGRGDDDRDGKMEAMNNTAARPQSLGDQLLDQWHMVETTPELRAAGEFLIEFIDEDGYLRVDQATLLAQAPPGTTPAQLDQALALLQASLEPVGLAARDLRECLLLQIDAKSRQNTAPKPGSPITPGIGAGVPGAGADLTLERTLVADYLKDIEVNRLPKIAAATGKSVDQIKQAITNLRQFYPHPGRLLSNETPRAITPDAVVEYDDSQDRYVARLLNDRLPNVYLSPHYLKMMRSRRLDRKARDFIGNNLRSARWLLEAIGQRSRTLLRVINVVIEAQREFFDHGPQFLKPLPMTLVADQLGIHVATVSRAVSEKYLLTPRGILPLRMFFSGGTETQGGESVSWAAVQAKLEEIIAGEDKANPLSDDDLVVKLNEKGIVIARRTVAKYRKVLHIAPARQRREF